MLAADLIRTVEQAGGHLEPDGDGLVVEAPKPLPESIMTELRAHKAEVMAFLQDRKAAWTPEDWRAFFDERAGIAEHDGGLSRADAERQAHECCVMEWLWRNPPLASGPERCAHCGQPLGEIGRYGLPYLKSDGRHTWLHSGCHGDWKARRRAEAVAALAILGLPTAPARSDSPHRIRRPGLVPTGKGARP